MRVVEPFDYRCHALHGVSCLKCVRDLSLERRAWGKPSRFIMRILIAGGTGFVGAHLVRALIARGDTVTVLSRDVGSARRELPRDCRVAHWDPSADGPWADEFAFADAVVNLAGAPVAQRWTDTSKRLIKESRLTATRAIVRALDAAGASTARNARRPAVLINASAIG